MEWMDFEKKQNLFYISKLNNGFYINPTFFIFLALNIIKHSIRKTILL